MSEESKDSSGTRSVTRRKLVRGASVPAIYMLCGGSPVAAASLACRAKAFSDQAAGFPVGNTAFTSGTWLNVPAWKDVSSNLYVAGDDIVGVQNLLNTRNTTTQTAYLAAGKFERLSNGVVLNSSAGLTKDTTKLIAVKINSVGKIVSCTSGSGGSVAQMSLGCWSSFVGP